MVPKERKGTTQLEGLSSEQTGPVIRILGCASKLALDQQFIMTIAEQQRSPSYYQTLTAIGEAPKRSVPQPIRFHSSTVFRDRFTFHKVYQGHKRVARSCAVSTNWEGGGDLPTNRTVFAFRTDPPLQSVEYGYYTSKNETLLPFCGGMPPGDTQSLFVRRSLHVA